MGRIDDPFDAAGKAYPINEENAATEVGLRIGGHIPLLGPLLGVVNEARGYFSAKATRERLEALIEAVNDKTDHLTGRVKGNTAAIDGIQVRIESPEFAAAFREACVRTLFASDQEKIRRFGAVLGGSVAAEVWPETAADLTSFIRAIAELGERDIKVLQLLHTVFEDVVRVYPNMHDPNCFTEKAQELLKESDRAEFHRDDFYGHCRRLEGFGLAMEVPRNTGRMAPGDHCFRPTRRGLKLLSLLGEEVESPEI